ncbi:Hypothetical_protein [Hexamita inflata]|uniref:Hypothetical_protein n=1 Tax=Hexamita inflata TaxID=28002 RepID=A0AA86TQV7_9EUKA|nr:Hypothetical protein HINF_LOCUS11027 [Hexamita inflata]
MRLSISDIFTMFSFNGKLYSQRDKKLQLLEQHQDHNLYQFVKNADSYYFQFCDNVYTFDALNGLEAKDQFQLNKNLNTKITLHIDSFNGVSAIGGVLIISSWKTSYFVDMINSIVVERPYKNDQKCVQDNKYQQNVGTRRNRFIAKERNSYQFIWRRISKVIIINIQYLYVSYMYQDQIDRFPKYSQNCRSLLTFLVLSQYFADINQERRDKVEYYLLK